MSAQKSKNSSKKDVDTLYEEALKALQKKNHKQAGKLFQQIENDFFDEGEVLSRVRILMRICEREEAASKAKKGDKDSEELFNLGVYHHNRGEYDEALNRYNEGLKLQKKNKDHFYYAMAATEVQRGNGKKGLEHLKKAIQSNQQNRFFAINDPDFRPMKENKNFQKLVGTSNRE